MIARLPALATALALLALSSSSHPVREPATRFSEIRLASASQAIYSSDPHDSWNRIFYYLLSRRFEAYVLSEFPEYAPFREFRGMGGRDTLQISTRTFEREEIGDRPIDPLYPSRFTDVGPSLVLRDPAYSEFCRALDEALSEHTERTTTARALMQSDLWSAFDILGMYRFDNQSGKPELGPRRLALLDRIGRLIARIALTPEQIRSLPSNAIAARTTTSMPDLFSRNSGWIEIQWFPHRLHDVEAGNRRVTRIFVRPTQPPEDIRRYLNDFRKQSEPVASKLDAVALAIQLLLIDSQGHLQPSSLTIDAQTRFFPRTAAGSLQHTDIGVYEIRRQRLLSEPSAGGLVEESEDDPAYAGFGGNDLTFASPIDNRPESPAPLLVKLRTRCVFCHGSEDLTTVMTFNMTVLPSEGLGPDVRQLDPSAHQAAEFVMSQKEKSKDWNDLHKYFKGK